MATLKHPPVEQALLPPIPEAPPAWTGQPQGPGHLTEYPPDPRAHEAEIRQRAYFKAERRGFAPGHALDDWLEAERELDTAGQAQITH